MARMDRMQRARGCEGGGRETRWAWVRGGSPFWGVQAQSDPHVVGVAGQGRAWLGGARQAAGWEAGSRAGAARKLSHIKERAARLGWLFPGWGL